jgi:hypothetical protein
MTDQELRQLALEQELRQRALEVAEHLEIPPDRYDVFAQAIIDSLAAYTCPVLPEELSQLPTKISELILNLASLYIFGNSIGIKEIAVSPQEVEYLKNEGYDLAQSSSPTSPTARLRRVLQARRAKSAGEESHP